MMWKGSDWFLWDRLDRVQLKIEIDWEEHARSKAAHLIVSMVLIFRREMANDVHE